MILNHRYIYTLTYFEKNEQRGTIAKYFSANVNTEEEFEKILLENSEPILRSIWTILNSMLLFHVLMFHFGNNLQSV